MLSDSVDPVISILRDLASLVGLYIAAQDALKRYIALSSHLPSPWYIPPEDTTALPFPLPAESSSQTKLSSSTSSSSSPISSRWSALLSQRSLEIAVGLFAWPVILLVQRKTSGSTSPWWPDLIWGTIAFIGMIATFGIASTVIYPDKIAWSLRRPQATLEYTPHITFLAPHKRSDDIRTIFAYSLSALVMIISPYSSSKPFLPIFAGALVVVLVPLFRGPKMAIAQVVPGMVAFVIAVPLLSSLMYFIHHPKETTSAEEEANSQTRPSIWLGELLLTVGSMFPIIFPGIITLMTFRFEYQLTHSRPERLFLDPVPPPSTLPSFPRPIFHGALASHALSLLFAHHILPVILTDFKNSAVDMFGVFFSIPIVFAGTAATAWFQGRLESWWEYVEIWCPTHAEVKTLNISTEPQIDS